LFSGAAGLIYEVVWARWLALLFGSTALAQTLVLASFLGGLCAGSARLGRRCDRDPSALMFYARLEWLVAALGLAAPLLLIRVGHGPARWLAVAAIAAQAFFMGGTIPSLCRAAGGQVQIEVGRIYSANSAGAVLGCLLAGFWLIPAAGLAGTFAAAAGLNALVGLAAWALRRRAPAAFAGVPEAEPATVLPLSLVYGAIFLSGLVALAYEVAWTRFLALILGSSVYSFAEMLAAFITGISVGSFLASSGPLRRLDPARLLGLAELGAGASVLALLPFFDHLPYWFYVLRFHFGIGTSEFYDFETAKCLVCMALLLVPTLCLGMTLPLAVRLAQPGDGERGRRVGAVFAANTAGNVLGAFAGLLLLPWLRVEGVLFWGAAAHWLIGVAVLWRAWPRAARLRRALALAGAAAFFCYRAWLPGWDLRVLSNGSFRIKSRLPLSGDAQFRGLFSKVGMPFYRDDREATVSVMQYPGGIMSLRVNGKADASTGPDMRTQILLGEIPLLLRPQARRALLVGWGSGMTAGSLLRHPVERLDAVELIPAVVEASRLFSRENWDALADARLNLRIEDAKTFLARPGPSYDLIVSEPSNTWMAGVGDLFSEEFYRQARARLSSAGLMVQWLQTYEMNDALFATALRTFRSSFPHTTVWRVHDYDIMLVGSQEPLEPDFGAMSREFLRPEVRRDLDRVGIKDLPALLALQSAGAATAGAMAGAGPLNGELRPILEYEAPKTFFSNEDVSLIAAHDDRLDPVRRRALLLEDFLKSGAWAR
jgi:predicted membrane-bound spermidine synthase